MEPNDFIAEAIGQRRDSITYSLSKKLRREFPESYLLETSSSFFDIYTFHHDGRCHLREKPPIHSQWEYDWDAATETPHASPYNAWLEIEWDGHHIEVVTIGYFALHCRETWHCVLAKDQKTAEAFFSAVCEWNSEVRGEVLVCQGDHWYKSKELFESIQSATLDDLVLESGMRENIVQDLMGFFDSKEAYDRYGIAWKRGVLFLGPPGNGKTHAVKACINLLRKPCLYVKSLTAQYSTDQQSIGRLFGRARDISPCVLVFEDLDSLLTDENRAFFLNEMDGFASNAGILSIATTNHPERLDPAIIERPSRFDRKYTFTLPGEEGRERFLRAFSEKLDTALQPAPESIDNLVAVTEGYSYAYLKELFVSSMIRWIGEQNKPPLEALMLEQASQLRSQMASDPSNQAVPDNEHMSPAMAMRIAARRARRSRQW